MRGRGLKLFSPHAHTFRTVVAPHAGAWIETVGSSDDFPSPDVAPHAGAWIETFKKDHGKAMWDVAPHAGAWIETLLPPPPAEQNSVAPHAGAWIETTSRHTFSRQLKSPPMRGRGLKPVDLVK